MTQRITNRRRLAKYAAIIVLALVALRIELAQSPNAVELLSTPQPKMANVGVVEPSLAEAIIEEIGLHL